MELKRSIIKLRTILAIIPALILVINLPSGCAANERTDTYPTDIEDITTAAPSPDIEATPETDPDKDSNTDNNIDNNNDDTGNGSNNTNDIIDKEPEIVSVTISAAGDTTLGINATMSYSGSFDAYYDSYGPSYFMKKVKEILAEDDFSIVNLEGPLTTSSDKQAKLYNHRGKPKYVNILKQGSIEAVSLSNNHTLDYGISGYQDTVNALSQAGIAWASDASYGIYETKGIKIGFVSVDEHYNGPLVEVWLESGIAKLRKQGADIVIACIHWGRAEDEKTSRVDKYQIELSKKCIDWGYDLVIGNHAHVLQGINKYKGKYITYCLGNFCYGGSKNPKDKDTGIFQQTFTFIDGELQSDDNVRFIPCRTSSVSDKNNYQPAIASGKEALRIINKMNIYSAQYGVAFDSNGHFITNTLTEHDISDAYYAIFLKSLAVNKLGSNIRYVGIDISELGLSDTAYLESLFKAWSEKTGVNILTGSKKEIMEAGYQTHAYNGTSRIFIFETAEWSNYQVTCSLSRIVTLLNYTREDYISAYADNAWEVQIGTYIQK